MSRYELTRSTLADIELWTYIADDSIAAANRVSDAIFDACALLAEQPPIGHTRQDLTPRPVLFWSSGRYLIVYRPDTEPLRVRPSSTPLEMWPHCSSIASSSRIPNRCVPGCRLRPPAHVSKTKSYAHT